MDEQVKLFIQSLGALAEMSLAFFRAVLQAGGTMEEAMKLTQTWMAAMISGGKAPKKEEPEE